jgi:hypothetical protein
MVRGSIQESTLSVPAVMPSCFVTKDHRDLIKEAVEHDVYACILPPFLGVVIDVLLALFIIFFVFGQSFST